MYEIENLMREYGNDVLRTAYMYVKDYYLAEDIFQDVFIKINQKIETFQGESTIKTWIIRITINTCKDYIKSAYSRKVVPMIEFKEEEILAKDDYEEVENYDRNALIKEAVMNLPLKYRELFLCVYYQELSLTEAAQILHIPEGTAKSRMKRGRDKLKKVLEGRI